MMTEKTLEELICRLKMTIEYMENELMVYKMIYKTMLGELLEDECDSCKIDLGD